MSCETAGIFFITVFPLICTPGPDILFITSQGLCGGRRSALRAVAGVLLGYSAHAVLSAYGVAAIVAASPVLFGLLKWLGIFYLAFLALQMLRSSGTPGEGIHLKKSPPATIWRGFFTSFFNPKGLLMYMALLPQFVSPQGNTALQALLLSALFIAGCTAVYSGVGLFAARAFERGVTDRSRRRLEAADGTLLTGAALMLASQ
ncbi:MAG: LysE family translocator [Desulforhopalus sp.]